MSNQIRDSELLILAASLRKPDVAPQRHDSSDGSEFIVARDEAPLAAAPSPWAPQTSYTLGSLVLYNDVTYICIQAHTSLDGWQPNLTPALWVRVPSDGTTPLPPEIPIPDPSVPDDLSSFRQRSLEMPIETNLPSVLAPKPETPGNGEDPPPPSAEKQAEKLLDEHAKLSAAVDDLLTLEPQDIQVPEKKVHPAVPVPVEHNDITLKQDQLKFYKSLAAANLELLKPAQSEGAGPRALLGESIGDSVPAVTLAQRLLNQPDGLAPRAAFDPAILAQASMRVKDSAPLLPATSSTLKEQGIVIGSTPLPSKLYYPALPCTHSDGEIYAH